MACFSDRDRWAFEGRHYMLTLASTPDTMDLELDDVGPGSGRGLVALASCDDTSQRLTVRVFTDAQLPIDMLDRFLATARAELPGRAQLPIGTSTASSGPDTMRQPRTPNTHG